ncbi:Type I transmembrane sorting receptor, partial [Ascosphaera atra]
LESEEGMYYYECGADLPDFSVKFGDYEAKVPGKLLEYANTGTICLGGIQPNNGGDNILGDIFIKTQFVVFENNGDSARVGFAPQAGLSTSSSSSASSSSSPTPSPASSSFFPF